ncbi:phage integrase [Candidatus Thiodiazotropha sp. CDECU1]|uniref:phage integrase n=1 Tax=Candidatus Thiodiazotropha sp. CDECU1 TaxID=3065865 RepID=UPI00292F062E|nr:tyrosine-type recombinase/integrase [Candidatus Thiodiazotropha sp. CDECU1]
MINKSANGWLVDIQPGGRSGKRIRKKFKTKAEANRFEIYIKGKHLESKEWNPAKDKRKLSELIDIWWKTHGHNLKDTKNRKRWLLQICNEMKDPKAYELYASNFLTWRSQRIQEGNSAATVNNALAYLRAMINELKRINEWKEENPFANVRRIKIDDTELSFLTDDQIIVLLEELDKSTNSSARIVAEICLSTGARWSEAENLKKSQIGFLKVTFNKTKNGKSRTLPISDCLYKKLSTIDNNHRLFESCYSAFRNAVERARIELPPGQLSHVLRHTFASRFMMNGGNILVLQRALGHSTLQMTMRYAHLSPDHLEEVAKLNPLT